MSKDVGAALVEQLQGVADQAREGADAAQAYADQVAAAVQAIGMGDTSPFVFQFAIFVLAIFVGYFVVWAVTPALHTPLMSVTNAVSSVIVVGALLAVGVDVSAASIEGAPGWAQFVGFLALILASVNIFGGFLVTQRMLAMYKKKG